ncbi:MAG: hypothetical protein JWM68_4511 [Verrucomicrobiales bacterium]|nr:hypothetical protein [Verrucomicrobiales bacterium]
MDGVPDNPYLTMFVPLRSLHCWPTVTQFYFVRVTTEAKPLSNR